MGTMFANGSNALVCCDVCGFQYKHRQLRYLVVRTVKTNVLACPECWSPDQPQLQQGMYPVFDPQAIREPRPDTTYLAAGLNINGEPSGGSRVYSWGWAPVGGGSGQFTPNPLIGQSAMGSVTITA